MTVFLKKDIAKDIIKNNNDITIPEANMIVDIFFDEVSNSLIEGNRVELRKFGTFSLRKRKAGTARNPKTGETVKVGDREVIYFRAGEPLRNFINS